MTIFRSLTFLRLTEVEPWPFFGLYVLTTYDLMPFVSLMPFLAVTSDGCIYLTLLEYPTLIELSPLKKKIFSHNHAVSIQYI